MAADMSFGLRIAGSHHLLCTLDCSQFVVARLAYFVSFLKVQPLLDSQINNVHLLEKFFLIV